MPIGVHAQIVKRSSIYLEQQASYLEKQCIGEAVIRKTETRRNNTYAFSNIYAIRVKNDASFNCRSWIHAARHRLCTDITTIFTSNWTPLVTAWNTTVSVTTSNRGCFYCRAYISMKILFHCSQLPTMAVRQTLFNRVFFDSRPLKDTIGWIRHIKKYNTEWSLKDNTDWVI